MTPFRALRLAARSLTRRPAASIVLIVTLALGVGVSTAVASFVRGILLTPLPFRDADRLVSITSVRGGRPGLVSLLELEDLRERARLLEDIASIRPTQYNLTTTDAPPEAIVGCVNTWNLFHLLGVEPKLGATWPAVHDRAQVFEVVVSDDLWRRRLGEDPAIVGKTVVFDTTPFTILGVMPPGFRFPSRADMWRRTPPGDYESRRIRNSSLVARLRPGATREAAQAELDAVAGALAAANPDTNRGLGFRAVPLRRLWTGDVRPYLLLVSGAVALVLLIACVNLFNLLLVRGIARQREVAVRSALGATRGRIVRDLLVEAGLVSLAGAALGAALAAGLIPLARRLLRLELPGWMRLEPDLSLFAFSVFVSAAVVALAAVAPALAASRPDGRAALAEGRRSAGSGRAGSRLRRALVVAEIALAVSLLATSGRVAATFEQRLSAPLGFDPSGLLTVRVDPPGAKYSSVELSAAFYRRVIERLERIPGVESAAANDAPPLAWAGAEQGTNLVAVDIEGEDDSRASENPFVNVQMVSASYFTTVRVPVRSGRAFDARDHESAPRTAIVSEAFARRFWPGQDPIGRRIRLGPRGANYRPGSGGAQGPRAEAGPWLEVVGVAGDTASSLASPEANLDVYLSDQQAIVPETFLIARTRLDPEALARAVGLAVREVDPDQSIFDAASMPRRIRNTIWQLELARGAFRLFALLAFALAAVGVYGLLSQSVASRQREIAVRMAIGASPGRVLAGILGEALALAAAGGAIGFGIGLGIHSVLAAALPQLSDRTVGADLGLLASAVGLALLSSAAPAARALRIAPASALRGE